MKKVVADRQRLHAQTKSIARFQKVIPTSSEKSSASFFFRAIRFYELLIYDNASEHQGVPH